MKNLFLFFLVAGEESPLTSLNDLDENRQEEKTDELISFDSEHFSSAKSSSNNNFQNQVNKQNLK